MADDFLPTAQNRGEGRRIEGLKATTPAHGGDRGVDLATTSLPADGPTGVARRRLQAIVTVTE